MVRFNIDTLTLKVRLFIRFRVKIFTIRNKMYLLYDLFHTRKIKVDVFVYL